MNQSKENYLLNLFVSATPPKQIISNQINQRLSPFLQYDKDGLQVKYIGKGLVYTDITSVQAVLPSPTDINVFYFEVLIKRLGPRGDMYVGFADADFPVNKHPGQTNNSVGYKSDGKIFYQKHECDLKMPPFKANDIIGCGINYLKREIFFTYNGQLSSIVTILFDIKEQTIPILRSRKLFPTISLHELNSQICFNFGGSQLAFDIYSYQAQSKEAILDVSYILFIMFLKIIQQPVSSYETHKVVQEYLWRSGYLDTLISFNQESNLEECGVKLTIPTKIDNEDMEVEGNDNIQSELLMEQEQQRQKSLPLLQQQSIPKNQPPKKQSSDSLNYTIFMRKESAVSLGDLGDFQINLEENKVIPVSPLSREETRKFDESRKFLIDLILQGESERVIEILQDNFSEIKEIKIFPLLHAQSFIELIKKGELIEAILYAKKYLAPFENELFYLNDENDKLKQISINSLMGLLCYQQPNQSTLSVLLQQNQRELLADQLNKALLRSKDCSDESILETLIKQLIQVGERLRNEELFQGELFEFNV